MDIREWRFSALEQTERGMEQVGKFSKISQKSEIGATKSTLRSGPPYGVHDGNVEPSQELW